jgi:hypothetical protein
MVDPGTPGTLREAVSPCRSTFIRNFSGRPKKALTELIAQKCGVKIKNWLPGSIRCRRIRAILG